jgi:hypothetical protein
MVAGVSFCVGEIPRLVVLHVSPSEAIGDHLHVNESLIEKDAAQFAVVTVDIDHFDADIPAEDLCGEIFFRLCPESLPLLGRVDPSQANLVLRLRVVEDRECAPSEILTTSPLSS